MEPAPPFPVGKDDNRAQGATTRSPTGQRFGQRRRSPWGVAKPAQISSVAEVRHLESASKHLIRRSRRAGSEPEGPTADIVHPAVEDRRTGSPGLAQSPLQPLGRKGYLRVASLEGARGPPRGSVS